ncbi:MAG TPA: TonB-dependent receptor [Bacteroidetes bacterium]|nr:TonB-dependent receptor [Bacteroidota bacterium]
MKRIIIFIIFWGIVPACILAQSLEGKVVDREGTPLMDAYIFNNNKSVHAHTNELGIFQCDDNHPGDTLNISYLGYETKIVVLNEAHFEKKFTVVLEEKHFDLGQVVVSNQVRSLSQVTKIDLAANPVSSSQEILRKVPGLFIGQHAGGGKAEQLFLRGFDIDHGTDVAITVDGMPANMVSHAHGQGYADLHFLIPETVGRLDFGKGPYFARRGNFATAGYVDFQTKDKLDNSYIGLESGRFNTSRLIALFDLPGNNRHQNAYIATEYLSTDGPFDSPQHFGRFNLMGKYTADLPNDDKLSVLASWFTSQWDASGQIPQRAVDKGLIGRFGSIDDTEGGATGRTNLSLSHTRTIAKNAFVKSRAYYSKYRFELFSNFTFFLEDPENGDQIRQVEDRQLAGLESTFHYSRTLAGLDADWQLGTGLRFDKIQGNELSHTLNRQIVLGRIALGDVREVNWFAYANVELDFGKLLLNPGLRLDRLQFGYKDRLAGQYQNLSVNKTIVSPKFNLLFNPNPGWQFFVKTGAGFHSNDTRVVVAQNGREVMPAAYGADLGAVWKPMPRLWLTTALWYLYLQQEFVYVGDAGVVEPGGQTHRTGVDAGLRFQISNLLLFDADVNVARPRTAGQPEGAAHIPLAPIFTATGGMALRLPSGFYGSLRSRFMSDRPANEDYSIVAKGYFITDLSLSYDRGQCTVGLVINNLFNTEWNEAQFATNTRLKNEPAPVEELHFTPGTPFFVKIKAGYKF